MERLERAVAALSQRIASLYAENQALRCELEDQSHRSVQLDERLLEANQRRQDAVKRIDDLISQMEHFEAQIEAGRSVQDF